MNEVKDLNAMSDAELSECFAVEVAGWTDIKPNPLSADLLCGFNEREGKTAAANGGSPWGCPMFATDANAVLPWLDKCSAWQMSREANQYHRASVHPESPGKWFFAVGDTFPRAACCALIAAERASK